VVACYTSFLLWTVLWDRWPDPTQLPDAEPKHTAEHRAGDVTPMLSSSEGMLASELSSEDTQESEAYEKGTKVPGEEIKGVNTDQLY